VAPSPFDASQKRSTVRLLEDHSKPDTWNATAPSGVTSMDSGPGVAPGIAPPLPRSVPDLTRPREGSPRLPAGVLAVLQHLHAVDEDVAHPDGVLVGLLVRRPIHDRLRIEDDDIREVPFAHEPAPIEPQVRSRQARHLADGL